MTRAMLLENSSSQRSRPPRTPDENAELGSPEHGRKTKAILTPFTDGFAYLVLTARDMVSTFSDSSSSWRVRVGQLARRQLQNAKFVMDRPMRAQGRPILLMLGVSRDDADQRFSPPATSGLIGKRIVRAENG
jgi:hypothetical protein